MPESNGINGSDFVLPEKHALYYLMPITIQVDDHLFKVPRHGFMQYSPIFRDTFSIPQSSTCQLDGSSDKNPMNLPVSISDFRYLLEVIYPLETPPSPTLSKDGWTAVLKLAILWEMDKLRELAITKLTAATTAIEKIVLAKEYYVPQWLRSGYQELVDREEMLSIEDSDKIGYISALRVFQVREDKLRRTYRGYGFGSADALTVEKVFEVELADADAHYKTYAS
ncbi:hypothetical protein FPV67DRAFT_1780435 [Lyophyllum atratum]|nr:hypothetical protein FPV67DRAFT_1780435 [Lyophyllum atratum]